jgi:thiol-disulfide isomerase/thioredoxin
MQGNPSPIRNFPLTLRSLKKLAVAGLFFISLIVPSFAIRAPRLAMVDVNGKRFTLADYKGKVVFIDFWATWCPACVMATPEVQKIYQEYKAKGVEVLSLSMDENPEAVQAFIQEYKMVNRVALTAGTGAEVSYQVTSLPAFYLVDKNGDLANAWRGYHPMLKTIWRRELDRLLGMATP